MLKSLSQIWILYRESIKKSLDSLVSLGFEFAKLDLASSLLSLLSVFPILVFLYLFGSTILDTLSAVFTSNDPLSYLDSLILSPLFWIVLGLYGLILLILSPLFYSLSLYKYLLVDSKKPSSIINYTKSNYVRFFVFGLISFAILSIVSLFSLLIAYTIPFIGFCIFFILIFLLLVWFIFAMPYASVNIALSNLSPLDSIKNGLDLVKKSPAKTFFYIVFQFLTALPFLVLSFVFEFIWKIIYGFLFLISPLLADILDFFVLNVGSYLIMLPFAIFSVIFVYEVWKSIQK